MAIADANGFFFAKVVSDASGHHNISLTSEKYFVGQTVDDFIEFKRDTFFTTILDGNFFGIIERPAGQGFFDSGANIKKVRSIQEGYMSMGMEIIPGPRLEEAFILVRDRRGVQIVNLKKGHAHQLMLSQVPARYSDIRMLEIVYDKEKHETSLVTLYYEDYPRHLVDNLDVSGAADREGNKPLLACYTFNREFQSGLISLEDNSKQDRTIYDKISH